MERKRTVDQKISWTKSSGALWNVAHPEKIILFGSTAPGGNGT